MKIFRNYQFWHISDNILYGGSVKHQKSKSINRFCQKKESLHLSFLSYILCWGTALAKANLPPMCVKIGFCDQEILRIKMLAAHNCRQLFLVHSISGSFIIIHHTYTNLFQTLQRKSVLWIYLCLLWFHDKQDGSV